MTADNRRECRYSPRMFHFMRPRIARLSLCLAFFLPLELLADNSSDGIVLHARDAVTHGERLQYEPQPNKDCLGFWTNPSDWAEWRFQIDAPGNYEIEIWQGCGKDQGGSKVRLAVADETFDFIVEETGHFQIFIPRKLGRVALSAGEHRLSLKPQHKQAAAIMDVRQIRLLPVQAANRRPLIRKLGTVDLDLVETTPLVFQDRLWRFEWVRHGIGQDYWHNQRQTNYFRLRDPRSGELTAPFADGHEFGSAFVHDGTVYVTGTYGRSRINMFASRDLKHWESWPVISEGRYGIFNTSICRAGDRFVLMFEIDRPAEETGAAFTARFATSPDLRDWTITPPECNYAKNRYTAPHALRWLDGWFYNFYLEAHEGYEMRVVRSRDLVHWEPSPLNPVLRASPEDKRIANPQLTQAQRTRIAHAKNLNNSDIDFCEVDGRLIINYSWGNQQGIEHLAEAVYDGTLEQFLRGWFPE